MICKFLRFFHDFEKRLNHRIGLVSVGSVNLVVAERNKKKIYLSLINRTRKGLSNYYYCILRNSSFSFPKVATVSSSEEVSRPVLPNCQIRFTLF